MALLTVNLPDNLKEEFKIASFLSKRSMSDIVLDSVKKFVDNTNDNYKENYSFKDLSKDTQQAILDLRNKEYADTLPTYKNADEMFRALGVK